MPPDAAPENTAMRVALWRALHLEADAPPYVFVDDVGLKLAAPEDDWRSRPDMSPFTGPFRASILARARFIEDLVVDQAARGVGQYVILGAGLDTFAQRRPRVRGLTGSNRRASSAEQFGRVIGGAHLTVGAREQQEFWIPAEDLLEFDDHIVGRIEVVARFGGR
ncbi:MAG TPA: class I SAM-dependent methyltransferase [Gemmatimonadaceae bacterium]